MVVFHSIHNIYHGPPLSYHPGKKFETRKKQMPIPILNSVALNSKNSANSDGGFQI